MGEEKDVSVTIYDHAKQPEIWKFQQLEDKEYHLIHTDSEGRRAAFEAFVIRLGKNYFIDFFQPTCHRKLRTASVEFLICPIK